MASTANSPQRLGVLKTYKLYIGGKFPRGESGRVRPATGAGGAHLGNYCLASRKDLREAVVAARKAQPGWAKATAYLRGQILYRAAEIAEQRRAELCSELVRAGSTAAAAEKETSAAIDRLVYWAGWTDKYQSLFGSVNPVATPHFNFTFPEPTGTVAVLAPDAPALLGLVAAVAPVLVGGNTAILLASERAPLVAITLAEILATSDVPGGVVNILTGSRAELAPQLASHMDLNAIVDASGDASVAVTLREGSAFNLKRVTTRDADTTEPRCILDTIEFKTAWHPVGV